MIPGPAIFTPTPAITKMPAPMICATPMTIRSRRLKLRLKVAAAVWGDEIEATGLVAISRWRRVRQEKPGDLGGFRSPLPQR
jgi:hypothetical protein